MQMQFVYMRKIRKEYRIYVYIYITLSNLSRLAAKEIQKNHPPIHHLITHSILVENFKNVECVKC